MSQQRVLQFVDKLLPDWRKTRRRVLALGVEGLLKRRRLTLTGIARGLEIHTRVIHRVKRIWRFVSNGAVDPRTVVGALARQTFRVRTEGWVPVILDETGLKDRAMLLGAGTWYRGRALPLALYAFLYPRIKKSLWAYREGLLSVIWQALPERDRSRLLLIAADRRHPPLCPGDQTLLPDAHGHRGDVQGPQRPLLPGRVPVPQHRPHHPPLSLPYPRLLVPRPPGPLPSILAPFHHRPR